MKTVLIYSPGYDVAGVGISMKRAFDHCAPDWTARAACHGVRGYNYPTDFVLTGTPESRAEMIALANAADVLHVMEMPEAAKAWPFHGKRIVVQHLGSRFRTDPEGVSAKCQAIGAVEVVDMHDLLRLPHLQWMPTPVDVEMLEFIRRREYRPTSQVRIAHAPTSRALKSTEIIVAAVERLQKTLPIRFDLIEKVSNIECIARKARADLFVDELTLGYGVNALECWGMGIPVVSGIADPHTRELMLRDMGRLPFVEATADSLADVLSELVQDRALRIAWGDRGRLHAERFHSQAAVVKRAISIYTEAPHVEL